jgi:hypothetical protein
MTSSPSGLDICCTEEDEAAQQAYKEEEVICQSAGPIIPNNQPIEGFGLDDHSNEASAAVSALVEREPMHNGRDRGGGQQDERRRGQQRTTTMDNEQRRWIYITIN